MKSVGHFGNNGGEYEFLVCPNCGKKFGEVLVIEGRAVYKKDPCPRCRHTVYITKDITKDLTPPADGRKMPNQKGVRP